MAKKLFLSGKSHINETYTVSIPALSTLKTPKLASKEAFFILENIPVPKTVPVKSYRKRFVKKLLPYKLPTIVRGSKGDWFVKYFYEFPDKAGRYKEFRVRDGINYIENKIDKEKAIQELCNDIKFALEKEGYNPFENKKRIRAKNILANEFIKKRTAAMPLGEALSWYIMAKIGKGKSTKTISGYKTAIEGLIDWYHPREIRIDEITIDDIEEYLTERYHDGWSPRTYNNNISIIITFFNYLVAKRKLAVNPIGTGMLETMKNTAEKNKYYDQETLNKILPNLTPYPALRRFILWTYYSCARGTELRHLKIKHLDLNIKKITILADTGKTGEHVGKRSIPICQELMDIIDEDKLNTLSREWYIFGNKGVPGPVRASHQYFSDTYKRIKDKLEIDPNYTIYGFKHTRVCDLLVAGFDPIVVMNLTGHTDWGSFQKYIRELGAVMDKKLIGNTLKLNI